MQKKKGEVVFSTQLFWFCILPLHTMSFYICNSCYLNSDYLEYSGDGCTVLPGTLHYGNMGCQVSKEVMKLDMFFAENQIIVLCE
jgi:hypothetical protein